MILLDALSPPAPDQLVADCHTLGAAGCWVYAARRNGVGGDIGIGSWTPRHVAGLHAAGLAAPAVVVPGNHPGDVGPMLDAAAALGCDPLVAWDIETFSLPAYAWLAGAIAATRSRGWRAVRYGDRPVLDGYPAADGDWLSHGPGLVVRAGRLQPVPALPAGTVAWQYVVQVAGPHAEYDASVVDPSLIGGVDMTEAEHNLLVAAERRTAQLWNLLVYGDTGPVDDQGTHFTLEELPLLQQILAATGQQPPAPGGGGDVSPVLAALQVLGRHLGVDVTAGPTT